MREMLNYIFIQGEDKRKYNKENDEVINQRIGE